MKTHKIFFIYQKKDINTLKTYILKLYKENDDVIVKCSFGNFSFLNKYKTTYEKVMELY